MNRYRPMPRLRVVVPVHEQGPPLYDPDGYPLDVPTHEVVVAPLVLRDTPPPLPCGVPLLHVATFRAWPVALDGSTLAPSRVGDDPAQLVAAVRGY